MKYLLDTADYDEVVKWRDYIYGVTCNPGLLKKSNTDAMTFYAKIAADADLSLREVFHVFIQVHNESDLITTKDKIIYKVPLVSGGYRFIKQLKKEEYWVCGTMVYDLIQLNYAVEVGAYFCIVLHAKNENKNFAKEAVNFVNKVGASTRLIAASVRTKNDVKHFLQLGYEYATIPPDVMAKLFNNNQAIKDWNDTYERSGNNTS